VVTSVVLSLARSLFLISLFCSGPQIDKQVHTPGEAGRDEFYTIPNYSTPECKEGLKEMEVCGRGVPDFAIGADYKNVSTRLRWISTKSKASGAKLKMNGEPFPAMRCRAHVVMETNTPRI